jgi:hypothetical protein
MRPLERIAHQILDYAGGPLMEGYHRAAPLELGNQVTTQRPPPHPLTNFCRRVRQDQRLGHHRAVGRREVLRKLEKY